jgi:Raf kinase inhibitor-like YbhB/YbcL family protein
VSAIPTLRWSALPAGTRDLALFVDDPDAPGGTFAHWNVWGLSPALRGITDGHVPTSAKQAKNSAGKTGWTAPCPPKGDKPHRYVFTLFALKKPLDAANGASASDARKAVTGSALARGQLVGRYGR